MPPVGSAGGLHRCHSTPRAPAVPTPTPPWSSDTTGRGGGQPVWSGLRPPGQGRTERWGGSERPPRSEGKFREVENTPPPSHPTRTRPTRSGVRAKPVLRKRGARDRDTARFGDVRACAVPRGAGLGGARGSAVPECRWARAEELAPGHSGAFCRAGSSQMRLPPAGLRALTQPPSLPGGPSPPPAALLSEPPSNQ